MKKMKLLIATSLMVIMGGTSMAQELHSAKVNGIVNIGDNDIASISDLETGILYKTSAYSSGVLSVNQEVELEFNENINVLHSSSEVIIAIEVTEYRMSFEEFKANASSQGEIDFFEQNPVTDNTEFASSVYNVDEEIVIEDPIETVFALPGRNWFWTDCELSYGICIEVMDPLGDDILMMYPDKGIVLITVPLVGHSLTSDGYLPIGADIFVKEGLILKKGVYKASYSAEKHGYTVVAVDMASE